MTSRCRVLSRRKFVNASVAAAAAVAWRVPVHVSAKTMPQNIARAKPELSSIKALVFDVFGTVVDWRRSVTQEVAQLAKHKGLKVDGTQFADAWRARYAPAMNRVRTGALPWTKLDDLHRTMLNEVLQEFRITGLTESELSMLNHAWRRLRPWPDSVSGLTRLKKRFTIAPLSNGNVALMTALAKHAGLPWDCILGAELVRHYKPDPEVYRSVAEFLDVELSQALMVAAHLGDLRAAKSVGLRTAFVPRPQELGPRGKPDLQPDESVDVFATDFNDLARQLGV